MYPWTSESVSSPRHRSTTAARADGPDHQRTISSSLGTNMHFLTAVRSDADRIEIPEKPVASKVTRPVVKEGLRSRSSRQKITHEQRVRATSQ
jgi:hypothetical protein